MVQALSPNRTNDALNIRPLPRGSRGGKDFLDSHVGYLSAEVTSVDDIAIAEQVARELVEGKCLPQLLSRPLRTRVGGHIEVQDSAPVMGQHQKHIENLETKGRYGKEIDGDQLLQVILQEGAPGLRRRFAAAQHVFAHAALRDMDAKFEQLPVDAGCTPTRILAAHLADQISDLTGNDGSYGLAPEHLPRHEQDKTGAKPGNHRFGFDDSQGRAPVAPDGEQPDPQQTVQRSQPGPLSHGTLQHADLVPQGQVLQLKGSA